MRYIFLFLALALSMGFGACSSANDANEAKLMKAPDKAVRVSLFDGVWQNDRGSQVTFKTDSGMVSGTYQTNVGQPDKSQTFAVTGFVQGDQISFTVNFKGYGSITAWVGQMSVDTQGRYFNTLWHLTRDVDDAAEDDDLWGSITAGASTFRPIKGAD